MNQCAAARRDPSPTEIESACAAIRRRWTDREYHSRLACDATRQAAARGWAVPVIDLDRPDDAVDALWRE